MAHQELKFEQCLSSKNSSPERIFFRGGAKIWCSYHLGGGALADDYDFNVEPYGMDPNFGREHGPLNSPR